MKPRPSPAAALTCSDSTGLRDYKGQPQRTGGTEFSSNSSPPSLAIGRLVRPDLARAAQLQATMALMRALNG